jgi:hypothetical protein
MWYKMPLLTTFHMKKSLFTPSFKSVLTPIAAGFAIMVVLLAGTPTTDAQAYYGNYSAQPYTGCVALTLYQGPGSTDAATAGQVSQLQIFLNQTGYLSGVSGTYDNGTLGAVINFQRAYGIQITGTVGPVTRSVINQQSCGAGVVGSYTPSYPITNYSNGNNCYWTGSTYNSTYVCTSAPVAPIVPVAPVYPSPIVCNTWNGNYNNYGNNYNYCNYNRVEIDSLSAVNSYNSTTLTIKGTGFSTSGNTVYFGNAVITNAYSTNGTQLTFTVPAGYYSGTYGVSVKNASGVSSNTLSYIMSVPNNWNNNNGYNGYWNNNNTYSNSPTVSNISGPSGVQTGVLNTWTVTAAGSNNSTVSVHVNWGDNYATSANDTQQSYGYGSQTYSFSHVYQSSGTYTIRVTATDASGFTSYSTYSITVNGSNNYNNGYYYRGY